MSGSAQHLLALLMTSSVTHTTGGTVLECTVRNAPPGHMMTQEFSNRMALTIASTAMTPEQSFEEGRGADTPFQMERAGWHIVRSSILKETQDGKGDKQWGLQPRAPSSGLVSPPAHSPRSVILGQVPSIHSCGYTLLPVPQALRLWAILSPN